MAGWPRCVGADGIGSRRPPGSYHRAAGRAAQCTWWHWLQLMSSSWCTLPAHSICLATLVACKAGVVALLAQRKSSVVQSLPGVLAPRVSDCEQRSLPWQLTQLLIAARVPFGRGQYVKWIAPARRRWARGSPCNRQRLRRGSLGRSQRPRVAPARRKATSVRRPRQRRMPGGLALRVAIAAVIATFITAFVALCGGYWRESGFRVH